MSHNNTHYSFNTVSDMYCAISKLCHTFLIIVSSSQMRSCLYPKGNWIALLSCWEMRVLGQAPAASQFMRAVFRPPLLCVQWLRRLTDSPLKTSYERMKSSFSPLSPKGYPPTLAWMGGIRGWRTKGLRN